MALRQISALLILAISTLASGERLHEQIYSSIEGGAACFRRLNGTHQTGCSSSDKGAVGVVHMIQNTDDALWLVQNSTAGLYMAVVNTAMFHDVIELLISNSENVAGVLIYDDVRDKDNIVKALTPDSRCPNEYSSGPGSQCSSNQAGGIVWNEGGSALLQRDIPFPMFYLPPSRIEEIDKIKECYKKYNLDRDNQKEMPLCSLQLSSFMFAVLNSVVCMRRSASTALLTPTKVCDPLGDQNVYYSLFPRGRENKKNKKPVTLVTARIDTATLFDGVAPGTASSAVGMVTLISAATALAKMIPVAESNLYDHNVLWTLFNGEAFDYIGSQRVAYDIARGMWPPAAPLAPSDMGLHVEVGQIGGSLLAHSQQPSWSINAFVPNIIDTLAPINEFLKEMADNLKPYNISLSTNFTNNLPPSSLHSFRRILKNQTESGALAEVLLVDHTDAFTNKFYHSALDTYDKIGYVYHNISIGDNGTFVSTEELLKNKTMQDTEPQVKLSFLATGLARTLYQKVTGQAYTGDISVSAHMVDELLYCYLVSQSCRLLSAADFAPASGDGESPQPDQPAVPLYVGVTQWPSPPALFAGNLIALLTGNRIDTNRTACDQLTNADFTFYWLRGWNNTGECIQTTMNYSQALSPAFVISDYDYTAGEYSTWTESVWQGLCARVFVSASGAGARAAAIAGVFSTLTVGFITFWLRRHAGYVFEPPSSTVGPGAATGILRTVNC